MENSTYIVCPKCEKQSFYKINITIERHDFQCQLCKSNFNIQLATVRTKNSRSYQKNGERVHNIRIITPNKQERLINFITWNHINPELKSGDIIILTHMDSKLFIIENKTINQYYVLAKNNGGCSRSTGVAIGTILLILKFVFTYWHTMF